LKIEKSGIGFMIDKRLIKFLTVGLSNTLISYVAFIILYNYIIVHNAAASQSLSYFTGILWSFFWNKKWTFGGDAHNAMTFIRFLVLQFSMLLLSTGGLYLAVDELNFNVNISWFVVMAVITIINYVGSKNWVFRSGQEAAAANAIGAKPINALQFIGLGLAIVAVAVTFGLGYGNSNQNTYLIDGLIQLDDTFLKYDWFARETVHYHDSFSYIIKLVANFTSLSVGLISIELILRILFLICVFKIISLLTQEHRITAFMLLLSIITLGQTQSVAYSYIFMSILQPSSFGSAFTVFAFFFFLREKYLLSGLMLGIGGFMHVNFLILGFAFFGFAHVLMGKDQIIKRLALQFGPMLLAIIPKLSFLLGMASAENGQLSREIFQTIRSPHHYLPVTFLPDFIPFLGWHCLGLACLKPLTTEHNTYLRLRSLYLSFLSIIIIATLLTTIVFIPIVSQLFFWRMAPFSILLAQIILVVGVVNVAFAAKRQSLNPLFSRAALPAVAFLGIALLGYTYLFINKWYSLHAINMGDLKRLLLISFGLLLLALLLRNWHWPKLIKPFQNEKTLKFAAIFFLGVVLIATSKRTYLSSTLINGFPGKDEKELYVWALSTNEKSVFLVPPDLQNFRMHGQRAVVADWKSTPVDAQGLLEWYRRIGNISGIKEVKSIQEAVDGYAQMNDDRLNFLHYNYGVNYAVFYKNKHKNITLENYSYSNGKFVVISINDYLARGLR
jgi:putative flippase GtrA